MFKFGAITDNTLGESLRVTIIAAGFGGTNALMDQLRNTIEIEPDPVETEDDEITDALQDGGESDSTEELVPVDADGNESDTEPTGVTVKADEKQTPTSYNGTTIIRPESSSTLRPFPYDEPEGDVLVLDEERPNDADLIQRTVDSFVRGHFSPADLERPTFERNKTVLYSLPLLAEHEFIRSKLND